jgi:hypothetical protein
MSTRLYASLTPWSGGIDFLLTERTHDGRRAIATKIDMTAHEDAGLIVEPSFRMSHENAQALMDELWNCGLRPSEGTGSAGALAATQKHLEDMRRLVFEKASEG